MSARSFVFMLAAACLAGFLLKPLQSSAESTITCPSGTYDMLDWLTLDSDLRASKHLEGSANPLYTTMWPDKFYWTKGGKGYPWDIQLFDSQYVYLWITEYAWTDPHTYKKFTYNTNMPFVPRCAKAGFPGATITVPNTSYQIHTSCSSFTDSNLHKAVNDVWGPYYVSLGGDLPSSMKTLVVSYRYHCDDYYGNCQDKEEFYLAQRYGLVQWIHYTKINGSFQQQQKSLFNKLVSGTVTPYFPCF